MTFYSNPKRDYVLNPRGKALYDGKFSSVSYSQNMECYDSKFQSKNPTVLTLKANSKRQSRHSVSDSNRFGTKMLEKMGWSKGKGLGANLDGQLEFIKVSHKGDQKGVGFKDRDDQWTTHESNFNSLLSSFQSAENSDEDSGNCAVQHFQSDDKPDKSKKEANEKEGVFSGVSLEERSKNSRARVHYKKFTRGKDLARYSEKDLANIFGKKSLKCEAESPTHGSDENENSDRSPENTPNFGITTIETGTTINDYFKNKMKNIVNGSKKSSNEEDVNLQADVSSSKKEKKRNKKSKSSESSMDHGSDNKNQVAGEESAVAVQLESTLTSESGKRKRVIDNAEEQPKSKKKKKSNNKTVKPLESEKSLEVEVLSTTKKPKKSKKEKLTDSSQVETATTDEPSKGTCETISISDCETVNETQRTKKSKKSKKSAANEYQSSSENKSSNETVPVSDSHNVDSENAQPKKKSKKNRRNEQLEISNDVPPTLVADQPPTSDEQSPNLFEVASKLGVICAPEVVTDDVYEIRRFRTEIFRFVDLHAFPNSTLCDIPGYGYTNEISLKIIEKGDENRMINTLWNDAMDKYANDKKKKKKFVEHVQDLKKKNIFGI